MFVSMSRTIGNSIPFSDSANQCDGPMSIIWCTAGVSGIAAPAMRARRGLQTPQAMTTRSVSMSPELVSTRRIRRSSTSSADTSVFASTVNAPFSCPLCRIRVPACSESTTPTEGV
jgi:hypothetical protein